MKPVVTFGEIMCRLAAPGNLRLRQTRELEVTYAGAEASVAASVCNFGGKARYVTALPQHALGEAAVDAVRAVGVDTNFILRPESGRLGVYFLETGANQRPSNVIYDREESAIACTEASQYDWEGIFKDACWLHISGITPALSRNAAEATQMAAEKAKQAGLQVSCDLNFRKKLWQWKIGTAPRDLAQVTMREILPLVDVVIANEEDCGDVLGIHADDTDVETGSLKIDAYPGVARKIMAQFPNISKVAITLRESLSATHNNWGAMLFDGRIDAAFFAPLNGKNTYAPYQIKHIVDRVGGGDSFAAALIFALTTSELAEPDTAIHFAVAASCLKHSIKGDFNFTTRKEAENLMAGSASGRVVR